MASSVDQVYVPSNGSTEKLPENSMVDLLEGLLRKSSVGLWDESKTMEALLAFVTSTPVERRTLYFKSSDPHSVISLLVQQLLAQFSKTFLQSETFPASTNLSESSSLKDFLCKDNIILLLMSIQLISQQIDSTHPELADLLVTVLKTLLAKSCDFNIDRESMVDLIPFFELVKTEPFWTVNPSSQSSSLVEGTTHTLEPKHPVTSSSPSMNSPNPSESLMSRRCVIPARDIEALVNLVKRTSSNFKNSISERALYMLLISVLEGVSLRSGSGGVTQISSSVHTLYGVTTLFEDVVSLWLQAYNRDGSKQQNGGSGSDHTSSPDAYKGIVHIARITLRIWMVLSSQVLQSSLSVQQVTDVKPLLSSPIASVAKACFNLQQAGLFKGNEHLDHEFTLIILESVYSSFFVANVCAVVPVCSVDDFYEVLRDVITDGSHEWFTYLCSKLHGISETLSPSLPEQQSDQGDTSIEEINASVSSSVSSSWTAILDYSSQILVCTLRELIAISSHIKSCQKASKLSLTVSNHGKKSHQHTVPFFKPVVYSLEVATGFDKLAQRLCKIAQLLLDMFRNVPLIQLLSLQLLSETAKDTIGTISNFLSSISDPSVRTNPGVLDLYLELLENIWFQLSTEYSVSSSWWKKLSNYYTLLLESNQEIVCQVIYHLQCLFGHDSNILKCRITQYVIIPFHQHLAACIKEKCYRTISKKWCDPETSPSSGTGIGTEPDPSRSISGTGVSSEPDPSRSISGTGVSSEPDPSSSISGTGVSTEPDPSSSISGTGVSNEPDPNPEASLESNEIMTISIFMKLLAKMMTSSHSLAKFASDCSNIYSLFLFLPLDTFRGPVLAVLEECLHTLKTSNAKRSVPTSPSNGSASDSTSNLEQSGIQKTILQILLTLAFSVQLEKIPDHCLSIAEGRASLPTFGLMEVDQIEQLFRNTFEAKPIMDLLQSSFVRHLAVVADVWSVLNNLVTSDDVTTVILNQNHTWDVIQQLGPSLGSLLSRLQQKLSREMDSLGSNAHLLDTLRENTVTLLSYLLTLAHFLCWKRGDLKILEIHCSEVQNSLGGGHIFSVANGYEYCTALLKTACCYSQQLSAPTNQPIQGASSQSRPETLSRPTSTTQPQYSSSSSSQVSPPDCLGVSKHISATSPVSSTSVGELLRGEIKTSAEVTPSSTTCTSSKDSSGVASSNSKPSQSQGIPITGSHVPRRRRSSVKRNNSLPDNNSESYKLFGTSEGKYGSFLQNAVQFNSSSYASSTSWSIWNASSIDGLTAAGSSLRSWVLVAHPGESDQSGYEADGELDKKLLTEVGESCNEQEESPTLHPPLTTCYVPVEIRQRIWTFLPITLCISLFKESIKAGPSSFWEKTVEVFLHQVCALLKADPYNVSLFSGKGFLETLLDTFSDLFSTNSERSITFCRLICQISEILANYQISASEARKLFLKLQASRMHLESLCNLLHSTALSSSKSPQPSAFVQFSYSHPSNSLEPRYLLTIPYLTSWEARNRCISMWVYVSNYPLQAWLHIFSAFTGDSFLQVWVCACSGDIVIRLCPTMEMTFSPEATPHSVTLGSVALNQWQHVVINILPTPMEPLYELMVVVDGRGIFNETVKLPISITNMTDQNQYFIAGGAVSTHTKRHVSLVNAEKIKLEWKLGSLHILNGFKNPTLSLLLYNLGPNCPSSNELVVNSLVERCHIECQDDYFSDTSVIMHPPISKEEREQLLETPILSYSAHDPHRAFLVGHNDTEDNSPLEVTHVHELQWVVTANAITRPQLLDVIQSVIGIEQIVYLYAKIVDEGCSEEVQANVLSLLHLATEHSVMAAIEFEQQGGMSLVQQVMRTPLAAVGEKIMKTFLSWCCGTVTKWTQIKVVSVLQYILLDWRIWHKAEERVWEQLLWELERLLHDYSMNRECFVKAGAIKLILLTVKERSLERLPPLSASITCHLVRLCECLLGTPPDQDCLRCISDHLLVSDLNEVKFVTPSGSMETSVSAFDARASITAIMIPNSTIRSSSTTSDGGFGGVLGSPLSPSTISGNTLMVLSESVSLAEDEPEEVIAFDTQPVEGRLPNSSYSWEDNLFTWTDITGQLWMRDSEISEEIPASIEVGLLSVVRKLITLLPDQRVQQVVGRALQHEALIAIAHNKSIIVRTAVIKVLDEYFKRGEAMRSNFVQVKGFNLLANQLKQFKVSFELMSALCSVVIGQDINLKKEHSCLSLQIPRVLSRFHMQAVIPVVQVVVNSIGIPQLCHSTLYIIGELFKTVKGMPLFMLNNGLLKVICQLISIVTDHTHLSKEDKEQILTDVLQLCNLVVIFSISADQEESFRMMDNLLVCVRHCSDLRKAKDPSALSVAYLHLFQYHILALALRYFEDMQGTAVGGARGRVKMPADKSATIGGMYTTLQSAEQTPGQADLNSRFVATISTAVDWTIYGIEPFTSEHAQYLTDDVVTLPTSISLNEDITMAAMDVNFVQFLISYFHKLLHRVIRKGGTLGNSSMDRQHFSITSRSQLRDQLARLFCHLISPLHESIMKCAALRIFWSLEDSRVLISFLLDSTLKKMLAYRLVLTITDLMKGSNGGQLDRDVMDILNNVFDVVIKCAVTKLRTTTKLTHLLTLEDGRDAKKRQKYETILEDMKNSEQRHIERHDFDMKGFSQRQINQYGRLVEKARHRQQAIDQASANVTQRIFDQQSDLKRNFLDEIALAGMHERDSLQHWRRVIILNTHPRALWSRDEGRQMCWQLDPTEGPGRVRRRLMRAPRTINEKHLLPEAPRTGEGQDDSPLSFIFENTAYHGMEGVLKKIVPKEGECILSTIPWNCSNISPDSCCGGNLIISNICSYFVGDEPLHDPNITKVLPSDEETTLLSWDHTKIVEIHRRRYMLQNNALEIFLINGKTMLLAFASIKDRDAVRNELLQQDPPNLVNKGEAESDKLKQVTSSWRQGEITNFEYLMELNKLAGRTFNDLMQYPVFPWILSDYKSKQLALRESASFRKLSIPVSIQDDTKVRKYKATYNFLEAESQNPHGTTPGLLNQTSKPYHYGSHYSNSGIVLHFLVRLPPFTYMFLAFQGRSFDIADRTFHNLATTWWLSSSESATDVKELIPEFYYLPEFFENREMFNFGERQNGDRVDSVILPDWSNNNSRLFILKHRQALECEIVSCNLHSWIDLVFGYKQTGKEAVKAVNVFHPATYYGADGIDIESITDETQRAAMRTMVKTYGQMPLQLFREPHPQRTKGAVLTSFRMRLGTVLKRFTATSPFVRVNSQYFWMNISVHRVKTSIFSSDCDFIGAQGVPDMLISHMSEVDNRSPERLIRIGGGELIVIDQKVLFVHSSSPVSSSLLVQWGTWDNSIIVRSTANETDVIRLLSHPLNRVTCCECVCSGQMLVSGDMMGVVSFWSVVNTVQSLEYHGDVVHLRGHDGAVKCLAACRPFSIVVTGSDDRTAIIWDTNRLCYVNSLRGHEGPVTVITTSPTLGDIATVCACKTNRQSTKQASSCMLRLWTINGKLVDRTHVEFMIHCLSYTTAPEGVYINTLIGGLANGNIRMWSSWDLSPIRELSCPIDSPTPVLSLAISSDNKELFAGYSNRQLVAWMKPKRDTSTQEGEFEHLNYFIGGRV